MKKYLFLISICLTWTENSISQKVNTSVTPIAYGTIPKAGPRIVSKIKWAKAPFDHRVFIENKGQFDKDISTSDKVFYQAMLGNVKAYFTPSGIIYRYEEYPKEDAENGKKQRDEDENRKLIIKYVSCKWEGANPNVTIDAKEELAYYYSYPTGMNSSVNVNIFREIVYKNMYPGIDIEYSFIPDSSGIKYSLIIHPGADISIIKMLYSGSGNLHLNKNGDAVIQTAVGEFTDHAPMGYLQNSGEQVACNYKITNNNEESFSANAGKIANEDLIIDPWKSNPNFTAGTNMAFDIDYDNAGNVYAYGGTAGTFQLTKFNSTGIKEWTFIASVFAGTSYGDFAVDKVSGTSYLFQALGGMAAKVNTLGALISTFPGNNNMPEIWRAVSNPSTRQIIVGGGGPQSPNTQTCLFDTSMLNSIPVNSLGGTDRCHDVCLMALDPSGKTLYLAIALAAKNASPFFNNVLVSLPIPALYPPNYIVPDGFGFVELSSITYAHANGMNGMTASPNWLYVYNGDSLKKINKATGAIVVTKAITGTPYSWGGLDVDNCDNVYVGEESNIQVYNSSLSLTSTIPLNNTVYDVVLSTDQNIVYAGGKDFVAAINVSSNVNVTNEISPTLCDECNGIAIATPVSSICEAIPTGASYLWEPSGQTTQTATNLCAGTYTVTITVDGDEYTDTVIVNCDSIFHVPNIFTPNGDGINDVFQVIAEGIENYKIQIFNRWGMLEFSSDSPSVSWDGKNKNGIMQSDGIYYYIITGNYNGKAYNKDGYLQLVR